MTSFKNSKRAPFTGIDSTSENKTNSVSTFYRKKSDSMY